MLVVMRKEYGPWVRHDWCSHCSRRTEQTRWYGRLLGQTPERDERGARCNECSGEVVLVAG